MSTETVARPRTIKAEADRASERLCELAEEIQITPHEKFDGDQIANAIWEIARPLEGHGHVDGADAEDVVNACRLAMEAGANEYVKLALVAALLERAPAVPEGDTGSVRLLVDTLKDIGGKFEVAS